MSDPTSVTPDVQEAFKVLVSLLEVTVKPATETESAQATLWLITSPRMNQRYPLIVTSNMYELPLLTQLHDTLEEAKKTLGIPEGQ